MKKFLGACCVLVLSALPIFADEISSAELLKQIQSLQQQMTQMKQDYDAKITTLNGRIAELENAGKAEAAKATAEAKPAAEDSVSPETKATTVSQVDTLDDSFTDDDLYSKMSNRLGNIIPKLNQQGVQLGISSIIDTNFHHDTAKGGIGEMKGGIAGFGHHHHEDDGGHHHHHGDKNGFNLRHIELGLTADVDPYFHGWTTLAFEDGEGTEIEEAVIQTTNLPYGLTLGAGKFMSGIGRINRQHSHTWDFMDIPLVYEKLLGGHGLRGKGIQLTWKAPTPFYLLFGAEIANGDNELFANHIGGHHLPDHDDPRLYTGFVKFSPELGDRHALQMGLSYARARHQSLHEHDHGGLLEIEALDGYNTLYGADVVYKYAGYGEKGEGDIILQGEYFFRDSDMRNHEEHESFSNRQDGYYIQALYGIAPRWRAGVRWEQVGLVNHVENHEDGDRDLGSSNRATAMIDWKLSEFSMLRLQVGRHNYAMAGGREHAWEFGIQLQISLGSHPAHDF